MSYLYFPIRMCRLVVQWRATGAGAVGSTPIAVDADAALVGQQVTEARAREAAELAREVVDPTDDVRGPADYKREMAVVFGRRALLAAPERSVMTR